MSKVDRDRQRDMNDWYNATRPDDEDKGPLLPRVEEFAEQAGAVWFVSRIARWFF